MSESSLMDQRERPGRSRRARLERFLTTEHRLVGASLLRIGIASVVLYKLLGHWAERDFLWGPSGVYPFWLFARDLPTTRSPSFLAVESEPLFQIVYGLAIGAALLFLAGWRTRWTGIWLYLLTWSLIKRNPLLRTGGDSLLLVMLPLVLLMNTSAYLSADSGWRRIGNARPLTPRPFTALFHNVGLFCVLAQLCVMYGSSGLFKLSGESWQQGTAVYYALRTPEFTLPWLSPAVYLNPVLVPLLTYATLAFELSFPLLIWSRRTRWLAVSQAVVFHAFIALFMGLVIFAAEVLIFQLVLVENDRYAALASRGRRLADRARRALLGPGRA